MAAEPEPYLTAEAVAARVGGMTAETVREWARTGVLRGYRPGGKTWLFLWSEVQADIAASLHRLPEESPKRERRDRLAVVTAAPPKEWPSVREMVRQRQEAASSAAGRARSAGKEKRPRTAIQGR